MGRSSLRRPLAPGGSAEEHMEHWRAYYGIAAPKDIEPEVVPRDKTPLVARGPTDATLERWRKHERSIEHQRFGREKPELGIV